jgi:PAS domain S-box-containing protein
MPGARAVVGVAVCVALWSARPASALDPHRQLTHYIHRLWDAEHGLPVNTATALVQTGDGYLWIGSQEGLVRYDGVTFTTFDRLNTPCLKDQWILRLTAMPDGSVWVIPLRGAPVLMKDGAFTCEPMPDGAPRTLIKSIVPAAGGGTWVGGFGAGVFLLQGGKVTRSHQGAPGDKLSSTKVVDLVVARDGALWVATDGGGVNRIAPDGSVEVFDEARGLSSNAAAKLLESRDGTIWVGTSRGVDSISGGRIAHVDGVPALVVYTMVEDQDGSMWFGSDDGLFRLHDGEVSSLGGTSAGASETVRSVRALLEDREGNLWVGSTGGGIERLSDGLFTPHTSAEGLSDDFVWTVYEDVPGRIWIGTDAGGLNRLENRVITSFGRAQGLGDETVRSTFRGRDGTLWVGTRRAGLKRFDGERFAPVPSGDPRCDSDISAIAEDAAGALWIAARGKLASHGANGVLCRLDGGTLRVIDRSEGGVEEFLSCMKPDRRGRMLLCGTRGLHIIDRGRVTSYSMRDGLSSDYVTAVYEDEEGVLWIGTAQGGLNRFKDGVFAHATTAQGLFDDKTHGILEDDLGNLWLSSNRGIARVRKSDLDDLFAGRRSRIEPVVYGVDHGMRTAECNGAAQYPAWRAADGRLWFSTMKGAVVVDPGQLESNQLRPQVIIERLAAGGVDWTRRQVRDLPPGTRTLEFTYTATSLVASDRIRFKYMLEGFDGDWVDAAGRRSAYYTNLPPGAYRFRVIAANSEGVWNSEGASIGFSLEPHFYQTWWFSLGCVIAGLALIFGVHRLRVQQMKGRERELHQRVEERTREIAEAAQALRASESYSRAIVGNVGEGIITFDGEGRISRWNAAAERIFAYSAEEAVGQSAELLGIARALSGSAAAPVMERARRRDGSAIPIEIQATAAIIDGQPTTIWLVRDLTEARRAEAKVAAMQRELIATSRRAGMAEVATSVLHNVGNALTSVNLSADLVLDMLRRSRVVGLGKATAMFDRDPAELAAFLTGTEKGRQLPNYMVKVNEVIQRERATAIEELESMEKGIEHIKAIVSAQQSHGKVAGVIESVTLTELLEDAVRLERGLCEMAGVMVRVDHGDVPPVLVDRHRLLEILMNLLVNAREALPEVAPGIVREIAVRSRSFAPGTFSIEVRDSGVGIAPADLVKIFHQGFTTKVHGHGFGLHASSCAAVELGGSLSVVSDGAGQGACFTLTLPIDGSQPSRTPETLAQSAL